MRGLFLLFLFSLFSISNAQSWRQCWGQEYVYYDSKCCDTQDKIVDEQFHCLDSIPKMGNYDDLQTSLHASLDNLGLCTKNSTIPGAESLALHSDQRSCTNYAHAVTVDGITESECKDHLMKTRSAQTL